MNYFFPGGTTEIENTVPGNTINVYFGNNITLKWKIYNLQEDVIKIYSGYSKDVLGSVNISRLSHAYTKLENLNNKNRLSSRVNGFKLKLFDGNGTMELSLEQLKISDSGYIDVIAIGSGRVKAQSRLKFNVEGTNEL